jgi:hypothetical protein
MKLTLVVLTVFVVGQTPPPPARPAASPRLSAAFDPIVFELARARASTS